MKLPQIQAIVFDAYGTLFDISGIDEKLTALYGGTASELADIWRRKQLEYTWLRSLMGKYVDFDQITGEALDYAANFLKVNLDGVARTELLTAYRSLPVFPDVRDALDKLMAKYRLAVLSNANLELLNAGLDHNEIAGCFEAVCSASDVRIYKPSPRVYESVEQELQLDRAEILFVSSNTWDISGAKSHGLRVTWLKRNPQMIPEEFPFSPDFTIDNLEDLIKSLEAEL